MKVATVVVTYNRKELLADNIRMQYGQSYVPDMMIIIDNHGSDGTLEYLKEQGLYSEKINFVYLNDNIGGAGGFEKGTRLAYELGFDFIILMDDDGRPENERTIERIVNYATSKYEDNKKLMLNSLVLYDEDTLSFTLRGVKDKKMILSYEKDGFIEGSISPFNGTLITRDLVAEMGFPRGDFFIKGDEAEYTMRAKEHGALVGTVTDSVYHHPLLASDTIKVLGKKISVSFIESPWKEYYRSRNYTYMFCVKKQQPKAWMLFKIRLFYASKMKAGSEVIQMIKRGYKDGKNGLMGKTVAP